MTEPTDAELDSIDMDAKAIANQNPIGTPFAWRKAYLAAFARAVLAKWGTPPAVAGGIKWQCVPQATAFGGCPSCGSKSCIARQCTTPQPTKAQAGAVPLTREQVKAICLESGYETATLQERADFINGIRHAERHHGIKGGQHGADT